MLLPGMGAGIGSGADSQALRGPLDESLRSGLLWPIVVKVS